MVQDIGLPCVVRPSFTLGGAGSSIAYNREEFDGRARGLDLSPIHEVLLEESVIGWKEFEMEVMRDKDDNFVIICSIENFDPMGVHTGDSITVAPRPDPDRQGIPADRDASIAVMREIGVETGGSNIQFAIDPKTGRMVVIEMNPRVSRSSAWRRRPAGFRSPRSPPSWPWAIGCTKCPTTSPARRWLASSRRSTTWSPRSRDSPLRSFPRPIHV